MDVAALSALLSQSTDRLSSLHAEIGHPPNALEDALELLHQALKGAVGGQIAKVEREAEDLKLECRTIQDDIANLRTALGDGAASSGSKRIFSTSSASGAAMDASALEKLPLLQRKSQLASDRQRLKALYTTKETHIDRLVNKLESYRPLLGSFVRAPERSTATIALSPNDNGGAPLELKDVSQPCIAAIEAEIIRCSKEVNQRIETLRASLQDITRLWTELVLEPCQPLDLGDEGVFQNGSDPLELDCGGGGTVAFDRAVLAHLQLRPLYNEAGMFEGDFASTEGEEQDGEEEGDRTAREVDLLESTPTRASFGGRPAKHSGEMAFRLPSRSGGPSQSTLAIPSNQMEPSEANLELAARKIAWLEAEKQRREATIQNLYDELAELWAKFDVPEEEMDAFVMDHRGSTLEVIEAYQSELDKMRSLKAQHMSLFILKTRERITTLWDSLFLTAEEREASFPPFFIDVSPDASDYDEPLPTDDILASHEQMIDYLTEQVRTKAPVLKVIGKYKELLDDERQLAESAADTARLLGRGSRGDPGRLLREEKMRKRVKVQKPRMEAELQKVIPAWEREHGEPFTINGVRYLDELLGNIEGSKENQNKKRTRPATAMGAPTPRGGASVAQGRTPGTAGRGVAVAQTPLRPITPGVATTTKKARMGTAPTAPATVGGTAKTPRTAGGPPSRVTSSRQASTSSIRSQQQPSTVGRPGTSMSSYRNFSNQSHATIPGSPSRIPMPSSPPKMSTRNFGSQSTDSGYGSRNVTGSSTASRVVVAATQPPRESFRPRPSGNLRTYKASAAPVVAASAATSQRQASQAALPVMSPGRISKWGEMGPPRWPIKPHAEDDGANETTTPSGSGRIASSVSVATSIHSDATTLIHPRAPVQPTTAAAAIATTVDEIPVRREPGKKYRRAPSMSLETCLANLAASSAASASKRRLGDGMTNEGLYSIRSISSCNLLAELAEERLDDPADGTDEGERLSRINGWKDGLRFAGAATETDETDDEMQSSEAEEMPAASMPRSGSNNWSVVDEDEAELSRFRFPEGAAAAAV